MEVEVCALCAALNAAASQLLDRPPPPDRFDGHSGNGGEAVGEGDGEDEGERVRRGPAAEASRQLECMASLASLRAALVEALVDAADVARARLDAAHKHAARQRYRPEAASSIARASAAQVHGPFAPVELGQLLPSSAGMRAGLVGPHAGREAEAHAKALLAREERSAAQLPALFREAQSALERALATARVGAATGLLEQLQAYAKKKVVVVPSARRSRSSSRSGSPSRQRQQSTPSPPPLPSDTISASELLEVVRTAEAFAERWSAMDATATAAASAPASASASSMSIVALTSNRRLRQSSLLFAPPSTTTTTTTRASSSAAATAASAALSPAELALSDPDAAREAAARAAAFERLSGSIRSLCAELEARALATRLVSAAVKTAVRRAVAAERRGGGGGWGDVHLDPIEGYAYEDEEEDEYDDDDEEEEEGDLIILKR